MSLPPRPKQPLLVRRVLALSTVAACSSGPRSVPPQVATDPNQMQTVPPQVNCAGQYAGECRGEIAIVVRDAAGATLVNTPVTLTVGGTTSQRTTDGQGTIVIGPSTGEALMPGSVVIKVVADGYAPFEQTVNVDAGLVQVDVVLNPSAP